MQSYSYFNKLSLKKQVIIGSLGIFITIASISILITVLNLSLIGISSYNYITNIFETEEDKEIKAMLTLIDLDVFSSIENSRFGIQYIRNYHNLLSNNEFFFYNFISTKDSYNNLFVNVDSKEAVSCLLKNEKNEINSENNSNNDKRLLKPESLDFNNYSEYLESVFSQYKSNYYTSITGTNSTVLTNDEKNTSEFPYNSNFLSYLSSEIITSPNSNLESLSLKSSLESTTIDSQASNLKEEVMLNNCIAYKIHATETTTSLENSFLSHQKAFIYSYPVIEALYYTKNRFFNRKKFNNFFFSFSDKFIFYYPYSKDTFKSTEDYTNITDKTNSINMMKYIAYLFGNHLLDKNRNYIDSSKIKSNIENNPFVSYFPSSNILRPFRYNLDSSAFITMISMKLKEKEQDNSDSREKNSNIKSDITLNSLYKNSTDYIDNIFFADIDNLAYNYITSSISDRYTGFSSQAFEDNNLGILLYNNCLKLIREYENYLGNTTYTDKLIEFNKNHPNEISESFPTTLNDCFLNEKALHQITLIIRNSTEENSRKSKVNFSKKTSIKVVKLNSPSIVSQLYYQNEYITNYYLLFLLTKVQAYIIKDKKILYSKMMNLVLLILGLIIIIWVIGFIVVFFFAIKLATNLSNSIKKLVEFIDELAQNNSKERFINDDTSICKVKRFENDNKSKYNRKFSNIYDNSKLEEVSFPYDDDINNFFNNCKTIIKGGLNKHIKIKNFKNKDICNLNILMKKEVEAYLERKNITNEKNSKTDDNVFNDISINPSNSKNSLNISSLKPYNNSSLFFNFNEDNIINNINPEDFEEFDSLQKVKRNNLTFNDEFLNYYYNHKNLVFSYYNNLESELFEYSDIPKENEDIKNNINNKLKKYKRVVSLRNENNNGLNKITNYMSRSFNLNKKNDENIYQIFTQKKIDVFNEEQSLSNKNDPSFQERPSILSNLSLKNNVHSIYLNNRISELIEISVDYYNETNFEVFNYNSRNKLSNINNEYYSDDYLKDNAMFHNKQHMLYSLLNKCVSENKIFE